MNRRCILIFTILTLLSTHGCLKGPLKAQTKPDNRQGMGLPVYNGPQAKVVVSDLEWKIGHSGGRTKLSFGGQSVEVTRRKSSGYTTGLREMLINMMVQTRRYQVLERHNLNLPKQENASSTLKDTNRTKEQKEPFERADLLIMGSILGWEPGAAESGGRSGAGAAGIENTPDASIQGTYEESSMTMDICIIDGKTSKVLSATLIQGVAKDVDLTGYGSIDMAAGLDAYANTPMEKAIRTCLYNVVEYIVENTPRSYLK